MFSAGFELQRQALAWTSKKCLTPTCETSNHKKNIPQCFLCKLCRISLVDKQFGSKSEQIYCGNCYDSQFASRCDGCGEVFRAGKCKWESGKLDYQFECVQNKSPVDQNFRAEFHETIKVK